MPHAFPQLALLGPIGWPELVILGILGVLIFGKRLPEVGKSIGKGIVEFKKGLQGISDDVDQATNDSKRLDKPDAHMNTEAGTKTETGQPNTSA